MFYNSSTMIRGRTLALSLLFIASRSSSGLAIRSIAVVNRAEIQRMAETEDILVPPREYGYRAEPFVWPELIGIIEKENNLAKLSRSIQQQKEYLIYRRELLKGWKSVYDHILVSKFDFEKRLAPNELKDEDRNDQLFESYPPLSEIGEVKKSLKPNDFPYYFAEGIEHWCLWKLCEDVTDAEIEEAKEDLQNMHGDVVAYLAWRNPPHLKSLPDIDHIHILCLRESRTCEKTNGENV